MASKRDYYETLELTKGASADQIKANYRRLAKKYHPDFNKEPGAEEKFKEVQEAYDVLSDDQKRAAYDQYGFAAFDQNGNQQGAGGFGGFGGFNGSFQDVDLGDIFSSFFGGGTSRRRQSNGPQRGNDRLLNVKINFMDAIKGKKIELNVTMDETCTSCNGSGAKSPNDIKTCSQCHGTGYQTKRMQSIFGMIQETQTTCTACGGNGKTITNRCPNCAGKGFIRTKKTVDVNIPAGINNGQQIRVAGTGERGINGGPNGDLYIEVVVEKDKLFRREGNDIHIDIDMNMVDAALGCVIDVPTVYGSVEMKIPEGSQNGQILKLKGKGVKDIRNPQLFGDQYVHITVSTPTKMTQEQRDLLQKFQAIEEEKKGKNESFFDKLKKKMKK